MALHNSTAMYQCSHFFLFLVMLDVPGQACVHHGTIPTAPTSLWDILMGALGEIRTEDLVGANPRPY